MRKLRVRKRPIITVLDYYTEVQDSKRWHGGYFWIEYKVDPGYQGSVDSIVFIADDGGRVGNSLVYTPTHLITIDMVRT